MSSTRAVTTDEVEYMVSYLYSDRAKSREEGVKMLTSILDSAPGLKLLDQQTSILESKITAWSWPGILDALCQCIDTEIGTSKKRGPKPALAKALRSLVQKAEDPSRPGKSLVLLRKVPRLVKHVLLVLQEVPSFVSDYSHILRQVLLTVDYRVRFGKKIYTALVELFLHKVKTITSGEGVESKEDAFQSTVTLHILLQNSSGDLSDSLKHNVVDSFGDIFRHLRDEGRVAKKLVAALNSFLLSNGLNLGDVLAELHLSVRQFMFRSWLTTRDRELKDGLVLYARAQLKLRHILDLENPEVLEELSELVEKELDQTGIALVGMFREERLGMITRSMRCLLELAGMVLFEMLTRKPSKVLDGAKRRRKESIHVTVLERLTSGKYLWIGATCMLVHRYGCKLPHSLLLDWLKGLASGFDRILADGSSSRSAETLLWTVRCLQESAKLWPVIVTGEHGHFIEAGGIWQSIWKLLLHWVPLLGSVPVLVEEACSLLGTIVAQNFVPFCAVPHEFWRSHPFLDLPVGGVLYFTAVIFSDPACQSCTRKDVKLRSKLIQWALTSLDAQEAPRPKGSGEDMISPRLLSATILALSTGSLPQSLCGCYSSDSKSLCLLDELGCCLEPEVQDKEDEAELTALDRSPDVLAACGDPAVHKLSLSPRSASSPLPRSNCDFFLQQAADSLVEKMEAACQISQAVLTHMFHLSATVSSCVYGVEQILQKRGQVLRDWSSGGRLLKSLAVVLEVCVQCIGSSGTSLYGLQQSSSVGSNLSSVPTAGSLHVQPLQSILMALQQFVSSGGRAPFVQANGRFERVEEDTTSEPLLGLLLQRLTETFLAATEVVGQPNLGTRLQCPDRNGGTTILDADLDVNTEISLSSMDRLDHPSGNVKGFSGQILGERGNLVQVPWRLTVVNMIAAVGQILPDAALHDLESLMAKEHDPKMRWEMIRHVFHLLTVSTLPCLPNMLRIVQDSLDDCQEKETSRYELLDAIDVLFFNLSRPVTNTCQSNVSEESKFQLSEEVSSQIRDLIAQVVDMGIILWQTRSKLAKVLATFILVDATTAESLMDKLLPLLSDPEYRVRMVLSKILVVLFERWEGHEELLQDISPSLGLEVSWGQSVDISKPDQSTVCKAETAIVTHGELAAASCKVENEVVFRICAHAASFAYHRPLVSAVLDRVAKKLQYPSRGKYIGQLMGGILHRWVVAGMSLVSLLEIRGILVEDIEAPPFIELCCPWLLPSLLFMGCDDGIACLSNVASETTATLLKRHFPAIFSALLLLHSSGSEPDQETAATILQGSMLTAMEVSEDERDKLIKQKMVSIVSSMFLLCSGDDDQPQRPFFSKDSVASSVRTVVDGFLELAQFPQDGKIVDKLQVFRPSRVFQLLLQLHHRIQSACHPWHLRRPLASVAALIHVIDIRSVIPSTFRYLVHIILQSIGRPELQEQCCLLLKMLLDKVDVCPAEQSTWVLGDHLQLIVSKLVSCCSNGGSRGAGVSFHNRMASNGGVKGDHKFIVSLLHRVTIDAHESMHCYIKALDRLPNLPCFERINILLSRLHTERSLATELVELVKRAPNLSPHLRLSSLLSLYQQLPMRKEQLYERQPGGLEQAEQWRCRPDVVAAVWDLLLLCDDQDDTEMRGIAAEFLAAAGIASTQIAVSQSTVRLEGTRDVSIDPDLGVHEDVVRRVLLQLHGCMTDNDVSIIELASTTLTGLLSTEKGHRVLHTLDPHDKSYLQVWSKGVSSAVVENILDQAGLNSPTGLPADLEGSNFWDTTGRPYGNWVCMLVHGLINQTNETIVRLCQSMVLRKTALAELLFPHVLGLLAGKLDSELKLCNLISAQVVKHVFCDTNNSTRSILLFLEGMNSLRVSYVSIRMKHTPSASKKGEASKVGDRVVSSAGKSSASKRGVSFGSSTTDFSNVDFQSVWTWPKVYWLRIDYLKTAKAAQKCAAFSTSALYVEHWCEETFGRLTLGEPDFSSDESLPLHVELLLTVCTKTSEPDSMYGVVRSHKLLSQLLMYENEGDWSKALEGYDLLLRSSRAVSVTTNGSQASGKGDTQEWRYYKGLIKSLQQTGCSHVLAVYYNGLAQQKSTLLDDSEFKELQFEAAWRAGKWDLDCLAQGTGEDVGYHANLYSCLRSLLEGDVDIFLSHLKQSRQDIVSCIAHASMESTQNVNSDIVKLKVLDCLSQAWEMRWSRPRASSHEAQTDLWSSQPVAGPLVPSHYQMGKFEVLCQENMKQMQMDYNLVEHFSAFCKTLFSVIGCKHCIPRHLLEFARVSRKAKRLNHATICLHELKVVCNELMECSSPSQLADATPSELSRIVSAGKVEEAKVLWAQGQQELALNLAKYVLRNYDTDPDTAALYCLTGKWLSESRSGSSRDILDSYLKKAVQLLDDDEKHKASSDGIIWMKQQCRTHYHLAHYTDALYISYEERLSSTEWKSAMRLRQRKFRELEALTKRLKAAAKGEQQQHAMRWQELKKQLALDSEEAQHLEEDKEYFLISSLQSYSACLTMGTKYDLQVVFRLVSLWFNLSSNPDVIQEMQQTTEKVHSYKFLPLVYQIASRMGNPKDPQSSHGFQSALASLVAKMAIEHPYHSLYQMLALANGDRVKVQQRNRNAFVVDMDKKQAAENLLLQIQSRHPILLQQMRKMVEMYIKLAELESKKEQMNKKIAVPRDVRSVRQLELVPVITAHISIDRSCSYSPGTFPHFQGLCDGIQVMHGVNAPKVLECMGSDGQKYRQLAKSGDDDLRQDAVMEQLFGLVNTLLQDNPDTRKRRLGIRTYKVVPFTPSAGVLEWVNGTIPLGEYLLGGGQRTGGAHGRYGENDWSFGTCREKMATEKDKRKAFEMVCQHFRPVMHYFFIEKFSQPAEWFEKRLAYTRSVAASSMVGYIVGLGDRHSMNILLDQDSAEVVHIDLGVAFEQGLMLKTPERVPFRLTRDMVDGMGVSGVEGVFRRCCEATLSVMRMNKEALLTIIEVFIHDPLYKWALSPLKALQRQQEVSDDEEDSFVDDDDLPAELEGNKDAARALLRVKQKLDGYEGEMRSLEGQVQQLIQDAQEPERLCQMFPGWGAWL